MAYHIERHDCLTDKWSQLDARGIRGYNSLLFALEICDAHKAGDPNPNNYRVADDNGTVYDYQIIKREK